MSVDCSTEDVPFREGTFGGAGEVVPIPTPGFPFLASGASTQASYLLSLEAKAKPAHLSYEVAGCAAGSARPLSAHLIRGQASKPLHFELGCPFAAHLSTSACRSEGDGLEYLS
jgi:hypothetical protein